jgi:hypothetical protein
MQKRGCGIDDLKFVDYTSWRRFRSLYFLKSQLTPSASSVDILPKKKVSGVDQTDPGDGSLQTSQHNFKGLCHEKKQISYHVSRVDISPKEKKTSRYDQNDPRDGSLQTSQHKFNGLCHEKVQISCHVSRVDITPKEKNLRDDQKDPRYGTLQTSQHTFKGLCHGKKQISYLVSRVDLPPKKRKCSRDTQTDVRDGQVGTSQYSAARKKLKTHAEVPTTRTCHPGLDFSDGLNSPRFKCLSLRKDKLLSHASSGDIPPKGNKNLTADQTDTREEKLEISEMIKLCGVSVDISDAETEPSCPLTSNEHRATLGIESRMTNHSPRRSYEIDVGNDPAKIERPKLKVSEEEQKAGTEDISFFQSLIPHVKGLSPARKMLLRIKTQELIYNFVYNKEV